MANTAGENSQQTAPKKKNNWIWKLLFVLLIAAVIASTAYADFTSDRRDSASFAEVMQILGANWYYCVLALAAFAGVLLFETFKVNNMIRELTGVSRPRVAFETAILGKYYDNVTPFGAGGQPFQAIHMAKNGVPEGIATAIAITSFFATQAGFFVIAVVSAIVGCSEVPEAVKILSYIGIVLGVFVPCLTVIFSLFPKFGTSIVDFFLRLGCRLHLVRDYDKASARTLDVLTGNAESLKRIYKKPKIIGRVILFGIAERLSQYSIAYFVLRFFGFDMPGVVGFAEWLLIVQICSYIYAAVTFVPTPGNSGAADGTFYWLFCEYLAVGLGFSAMMTWRIFSFYLFLLVGVITVGLISRRTKRQAKLKSESSKAAD